MVYILLWIFFGYLWFSILWCDSDQCTAQKCQHLIFVVLIFVLSFLAPKTKFKCHDKSPTIYGNFIWKNHTLTFYTVTQYIQ